MESTIREFPSPFCVYPVADPAVPAIHELILIIDGALILATWLSNPIGLVFEVKLVPGIARLPGPGY